MRASSHAAAESYESFNDRYASFFANAQDLFELQRGLNNCFAYDLVPSGKGASPPLSSPSFPAPCLMPSQSSRRLSAPPAV